MVEIYSSTEGRKNNLDYFFLRVAAAEKPFNILNVEAHELTAMKDAVIIAAIKEDKILVAVALKDKTSFLEWFRNYGFEFQNGSAINKRLSQLMRPFSITGKIETGMVRVKLFSRDRKAQTTDGAIVISQPLFDIILAQNPAMGNPGRVLNGRIFIPGMKGMLKGQIFVSDKLVGLQIVSHKINLKPEIRLSSKNTEILIGLEPQPGKKEGHLGKMMLRNHLEMFGAGYGIKPQDSQIYKWVKANLENRKATLESGKYVEDYQELLDNITVGRLFESETTAARLWLAKAVGLRIPPLMLPALLKRVTTVGLTRMASYEDMKVRIQIPGATTCQMVSVDVMRMLGEKTEVKAGEIVYLHKYKVYVVTNTDYTDNLLNHGGMDADDKLVQIFWKTGGITWVFSIRNPCARGEYSLFKFKGKAPVNVREMAMPNLPPQITEWIKTHPKTYVLPSSQDDLTIPIEYTWDLFMEDAQREVAQPGLMVNLLTLVTLSYPEITQHQGLPSMEEIIDTHTKTRDPRDIQSIERAIREHIRTLLNSKRLIDVKMLEKCQQYFPSRIIAKLKTQNRIAQSQFTKLLEQLSNLVKQNLGEMILFIEKNKIKNTYLDLIPRQLTRRQINMLYRAYRKMCSEYANTPHRYNGNITPAGYKDIAAKITAHMKSLEDYFKGIGFENPKDITKIAVAFAANNTDGKLDHIMSRKEEIETYLKIITRFLERHPEMKMPDVTK